MYHTLAMTDSSQILCMQKIMERDLRTTKTAVRRKGTSSEFCDCQKASTQFDLHSLTASPTAKLTQTTSAASNLTATPNKSNCDTCDKLRRNVSATNRQFNLFSIISPKAYILLVVCVLLHITSYHTTMTAPIMDDLPIWMSPCGDSTPIHGENDSINTTHLTAVLEAVLSHTSSALGAAREMTEKYVRGIWKTSIEVHHKTWKNREEEWLNPNKKKLPKAYNEKLTEEQKEKLQTTNVVQNVSSILMDSFDRFQRIAVGIEQIIEDLKCNRNNEDMEILDELREWFSKIQNSIRMLLCEIQTGLLEHNLRINQEPALIGRSVMDTKSRGTPLTHLRDWLIFREYVNLLEYNNESIGILQDRILKETKDIPSYRIQ